MRDSIVYITDTFRLPGVEVQLHDTIPCPEFEYHKVSKVDNVTLSVNISKGKMDIDCKADSLQKEVNRLKHIILKNTYRTETKIKTVVEYKTKWYYVASLPLAILFLIIILIFILKKFVLG